MPGLELGRDSERDRWRNVGKFKTKCKYYESNGQPIVGSGCTIPDCNFMHPDDPSWLIAQEPQQFLRDQVAKRRFRDEMEWRKERDSGYEGMRRAENRDAQSDNSREDERDENKWRRKRRGSSRSPPSRPYPRRSISPPSAPRRSRSSAPQRSDSRNCSRSDSRERDYRVRDPRPERRSSSPPSTPAAPSGSRKRPRDSPEDALEKLVAPKRQKKTRPEEPQDDEGGVGPRPAQETSQPAVASAPLRSDLPVPSLVPPAFALPVPSEPHPARSPLPPIVTLALNNLYNANSASSTPITVQPSPLSGIPGQKARDPRLFKPVPRPLEAAGPARQSIATPQAEIALHLPKAASVDHASLTAAGQQKVEKRMENPASTQAAVPAPSRPRAPFPNTMPTSDSRADETAAPPAVPVAQAFPNTPRRAPALSRKNTASDASGANAQRTTRSAQASQALPPGMQPPLPNVTSPLDPRTVMPPAQHKLNSAVEPYARRSERRKLAVTLGTPQKGLEHISPALPSRERLNRRINLIATKLAEAAHARQRRGTLEERVAQIDRMQSAFHRAVPVPGLSKIEGVENGLREAKEAADKAQKEGDRFVETVGDALIELFADLRVDAESADGAVGESIRRRSGVRHSEAEKQAEKEREQNQEKLQVAEGEVKRLATRLNKAYDEIAALKEEANNLRVKVSEVERVADSRIKAREADTNLALASVGAKLAAMEKHLRERDEADLAQQEKHNALLRRVEDLEKNLQRRDGDEKVRKEVQEIAERQRAVEGGLEERANAHIELEGLVNDALVEVSRLNAAYSELDTYARSLPEPQSAEIIYTAVRDRLQPQLNTFLRKALAHAQIESDARIDAQVSGLWTRLQPVIALVGSIEKWVEEITQAADQED